MPIGPSDLPWWGWLISTVVAAAVYKIGLRVSHEARLGFHDTKLLARVGTVCTVIAFWAGVLGGVAAVTDLTHSWFLALALAFVFLGIVGLLRAQHRAILKRVRDR